MHPGGQILLIMEGTGYYQERGKPIQIVHKGDVIKCLPGVTALARCNTERWHYLSGNYPDSKRKNGVVRTCQRYRLQQHEVAR
jgi:quercetin dioxygenase-like cupin family protein